MSWMVQPITWLVYKETGQRLTDSRAVADGSAGWSEACKKEAWTIRAKRVWERSKWRGTTCKGLCFSCESIHYARGMKQTSRAWLTQLKPTSLITGHPVPATRACRWSSRGGRIVGIGPAVWLSLTKPAVLQLSKQDQCRALI